MGQSWRPRARDGGHWQEPVARIYKDPLKIFDLQYTYSSIYHKPFERFTGRYLLKGLLKQINYWIGCMANFVERIGTQ